MAKKQALVTSEMLLETYTANLEAKYASLIQSEQPISQKWSWLSWYASTPMLTSRVSIGSEDISWGSRKNPFIEIPFPDDWHWIFLPSCSVSVKAVYSSFAIWNRAHGHLLISLHPTCFCVQPRLNAERSQYKWRFQSIYLSVQPRLNARDRCKSDFILPVDIFREARRGLSDKYLLRSQRVSPIIYWAKIIQYNPHSISTKPFLSPLIFYWAVM